MLEDKALKTKVIIDTKELPKVELSDDDIILNQSDNLLDLLEVGDCVEDANEDIEHVKNNEQLIWVKGFAVAIWKRNGDVMRRYPL